MSEVQRFDLTELTDTYCGEEVTKHYISPVEDGEYVQHSDYESLQARLAQCEREREQEAHGRKLYSDELNRAKNRICQEAGIDPERGYEAGITALKAERIAELERSAQIEEGE